jgi:hypothetical protein
MNNTNIPELCDIYADMRQTQYVLIRSLTILLCLNQLLPNRYHQNKSRKQVQKILAQGRVTGTTILGKGVL